MKLQQYLNHINKLIAVISISVTIVWACADYSGFWPDYEPVYFSPTIADTSGANELFYFSRHTLNTGTTEYGAANDIQFREVDVSDNIEDWHQYLSAKIAPAHIHHFLYNSEAIPHQACRKQEDFIRYYQSDTLIRFLNKTKNKKALQYLFIAKRNEYRTDVFDDGWNNYSEYDYYGNDSLNAYQPNDGVERDIKKALSKKQPSFYYKRYAFQLLRYYRYTNDFEKVDSLFSHYWSPAEKNFLYREALNYECDAMNGMKRFATANYFAAILFNEYPAKRLRAYQQCNRSTPIDSVLVLCMNNRERSYVYTLYAFKDFYPNISLIEKALTLGGNTNLVDLLITREINKMDYLMLPESSSGVYNIEQEQAELFGQALTDDQNNAVYAYPEKEEFKTHISRLLNTLIAKGNGNTAFYKLALAHFYSQQQEYNDAYKILMSLSFQGLSPRLKAQYLLTSYLNFIRSADLKKEANLGLAYQKIRLIEQYQNEYYNYDYLEQSVRLILQGRLIHQKDFARAYLLGISINEQYHDYDILENYARAEDIDRVFYILKYPGNDLDGYLKKVYSKKGLETAKLKSIQGSLYLRQSDVLNAHLSFKQTGETFIPINYKTLNTNPDGHPFYPYYYQLPDSSSLMYLDTTEFRRLIDRSNQYRLVWNNYSITREMLRLMLAIAKKEGNQAENYFDLACLHFEITYHGRAYKAVNYNDTWSIAEMEYMKYRTTGRDYYLNYFACKDAIHYYEKALESSSDNEISARSLYALYRCVRYKTVYENKTEFKDSEANIPYLLRLHDKYAQTDYYRIKECWGLSAYADGLRK